MSTTLTQPQRDAVREYVNATLEHPWWCDRRDPCCSWVEPDGEAIITHCRRYTSVFVSEGTYGGIAAVPGFLDETDKVTDLLASAWDYLRAAALMCWLKYAPLHRPVFTMEVAAR